VGGGVEVAIAIVASFVCVASLVDVASAVIAALLFVADKHEQT